MATHSSATVRESRTNTITNALRRRSQSVLNDRSIDAQSRALIRYAMEGNDPWLAELVRRADTGESIVDTGFSQTPQKIDDSTEEKVERLAEIICQAGDESAAALLVLMGTLENCAHPKVLVNTTKHFAFAHCGEMNLYGIVDAQIATIESELLT